MDVRKICPGCMNEIENRDSVGTCPRCGYNLNDMTAASHQMQPFTILAGKYLVGKVIGEGGFGISYMGFDLNLELVVAIKEFYPNGFVTRESNVTTMVSMYAGKNEADVNKWKDGFISEARNLAKFSNLNGIVEVRDFFNENGTAYIVMEYIDGMTLKDYLKQCGGKIPADQTFAMMEPIIRSLSKVHEAGMIHRDISPDNIMITKYGGMKLLDFGAAREYAGNAEKSLSIMLKPGYAPEEQYRSRGKQGPWSDVYALTATIYKCITGVTPVESMERMREDTLKTPKELGVPISDAQNAAIKSGMAVYAENRIQNMAALHAALYAGKPIPAPNVEMPKPEISKPEISSEERTAGHQTVFESARQTVSSAGRALEQGLSDMKSKSSASAPSKDQKNKGLIKIAAVGGIVLVLIMCSTMMSGKKDNNGTRNNDNNRNTAADSAKPADDAAADPAQMPAEADASVDISSQVNEIISSISSYEDTDEMGSAFDRLLELAKEYGNSGNLGEEVFKLFGLYQGKIMDRVNNCDSQEPNASLYMQMTKDLGDALNYVGQFEQCGIGVNSDEIESADEKIRNSYKERMVGNFDQYAEDEIRANGVVSRSELWEKMKGVKDCDLYDNDNPADPLRRRYAAALALYTDSELEHMDNDGNKIAKIREVLADTDYNPVLVYYLARQYGDEGASLWYNTYCSIGGDIGYYSDAQKKNFMYYYNALQDYQSIRQSFVEYMSNEF